MRQVMAAMTLVLGLLGAGVLDGRARSAEAVDLELVLLADASGSIDDGEIQFQRQGYASAITHPSVLDAIAQGFEQRIAVVYVEWGGVASQEVVVPWTIIDGLNSAKGFAQALLTTPRRAFGRNAIGSALVAGQALIEGNAIEGYRKVIDLSGDSANSWGGPPIASARAEALAADIVINGLAILCRACSGRPNSYDLEDAFAKTIIGGPASFVVRADGGEPFTEAVRRKLLLEIAGVFPHPACASGSHRPEVEARGRLANKNHGDLGRMS